MKVIHIAGWSGSGKTTFILDLVAALANLGSVGTIKHIGDHICDQQAGKDTTRHYEAGSVISAGIDLEKTMITVRTTELATALSTLAHTGIRYAVVEGFKRAGFQKVVFGDLDVPALVRNPTVTDVISLLPRFDDYHTLAGLEQEMIQDSIGIFLGMSGRIDPSFAGCAPEYEDEISRIPGVLSANVRVNPPIVSSNHEMLVAVYATSRLQGLTALQHPLFSIMDSSGTDPGWV